MCKRLCVSEKVGRAKLPLARVKRPFTAGGTRASNASNVQGLLSLYWGKVMLFLSTTLIHWGLGWTRWTWNFEQGMRKVEDPTTGILRPRVAKQGWTGLDIASRGGS